MGRNQHGIILLFTLIAVSLIAVSMFAAPSMAQTSNVLTFDNPAPPGSPDSLLNGIFQGIDFGTGQWRWSGPYGPDPTNNIYFASSVGTFRSFAFAAGPRILNSVNAYTTTTGTLTLSDDVGQTVTRTITIGSMQLVTTGWTFASTTVTITFTAGWSLGLDDITHSAPGSPDATPPTVSITSPTAGSTIAGNITVSASASDNVGVVGVQFMVDGANIGAEDTTPPYAVSWNTNTVANGAHTLTAVARDGSGNSTTSTPVTVTVSNTNPSDPSQVGQWAGPFNWPIAPVHMLLQPSGEVLIWDEANGGLAARTWNPVTNAFTAVPNNSSNLFCAGHCTLADDRAIVIGGHAGTNFFGIPDTNIYDPVERTWNRVPDMAYPRWYPTATTLGDGRVLAISGWIDPSQMADIPEVYNPTANTWTPLTDAELSNPMYSFMFVLPNGTVFNAGPGIVNGRGNTLTRTLNVDSQAWATVGDSFITGHSAVMYEPGRVMKSGTLGDPDYPLPSVDARTVVIDMNQTNPSWREVAPMTFPRSYHNLVLLPDGTTLAVGGERTANGRNVNQAVYPAELWNPVTETWTPMASMQRPRLYHSTALLLPDGRVLSAGGYFLPYVEANAEIYSPPYLFKGPRPTITSAPETVQLGSEFFVETPDSSGIAFVSLIRPGSTTHGFDQNQRYLRLTFTPTANGLNVQAPANANLAPPGSYMLFVVNTNGVPSIASFVRFLPSLADLQLPIVSITSPDPGSTVSGTVAVFADAADNVGVVGVQFLVDNLDLGVEDTTAPYSIVWNTTTVANGSHTLTAIARDAAGNEAISDPVTVTVSNASPPPSGQVAAYDFDEGSGPTVGDASGNNNNGTITGATRTTEGRFGNALSFDGNNDWITVNDSPALDLSTGMTLEAWVNPIVSPTGWRTVIAKEASGAIAYFLHASSNNNRPATGVTINGVEQQLKGGARLPANTWTHLASSYDGTTLRLYVNGAQVASRALAGTIISSNAPLRIGGNNLSGEFFRGRIDEVRIYSRALTQSEIQSDMNTPVSP